MTTTYDITSFIFEQFVSRVGTEILKSELKKANKEFEKGLQQGLQEGLQQTVPLIYEILAQVELFMHLEQLQRLPSITSISLDPKTTIH